MVNRWQGNTGKYVRVQEPEYHTGEHSPSEAVHRSQPPQQSRPSQRHQSSLQPMPLFGGSLSGLLPDGLPELDTEDIILLLILYLMYRESGDSELLIIMGAMFLL